MLRIMLKSKIHMATVTETILDYEGSIGIDRNLIEAVGLLPFEKVEIANIDNGNRFETYVIEAPAGSGTISLNGAAARQAATGDRIIIMCYALMDETEVEALSPEIIILNSENKIKSALP